MSNATYRKLKKESNEIKEMPKSILFLDDINRFHRKNDRALDNGEITQAQHDRLENIVEDVWWGRL